MVGSVISHNSLTATIPFHAPPPPPPRKNVVIFMPCNYSHQIRMANQICHSYKNNQSNIFHIYQILLVNVNPYNPTPGICGDWLGISNIFTLLLVN